MDDSRDEDAGSAGATPEDEPSRDRQADGGPPADGFVDEYEYATDADVIREDDEEGAVAGSFAPDLDVTPGRPALENALFVTLGVYVGILSIGRMVAGSAVYRPATLATITVGVAGGAALLYGLFTRVDSA